MPHTPAPRSLVIVPTYDEAENVRDIVGRVLDAVPDAHVLVVDDGSPDGTGDIVAAMAAEDDRVHLLRRAGKLGLGTAYVAGFRWGLERQFDLLIEMDADGSHPADRLPAMIDAVAGADHAATSCSPSGPAGSRAGRSSTGRSTASSSAAVATPTPGSCSASTCTTSRPASGSTAPRRSRGWTWTRSTRRGTASRST